MDKSNKSVINNLNKEYKQFSFDFVGKKMIFFIIIGVIFVGGLISFFTRGFNWDIDFVGGAIMEYNINKDVTDGDLNKITDLVTNTIGFAPSSVVKSGNPARQVVIKIRDIPTEQRKEIFDALSQEFNMTEDDIYRSNNVSPTVGAELAKNTIIAVGLAVILMLAYITIRFDLFSGIAAILCLIINMFVMLTFYSISQIAMNVSVIAAFLTILGYSINSIIVIFDRVRENVGLRKGAGVSFAQIINESTCQTLTRSLNTTITTMLTITCVYIIGVPSIKSFVLPLMVGITAGLFTSVCISGPLWELIKPGKSKIK